MNHIKFICSKMKYADEQETQKKNSLYYEQYLEHIEQSLKTDDKFYEVHCKKSKDWMFENRLKIETNILIENIFTEISETYQVSLSIYSKSSSFMAENDSSFDDLSVDDS